MYIHIQVFVWIYDYTCIYTCIHIRTCVFTRIYTSVIVLVHDSVSLWVRIYTPLKPSSLLSSLAAQPRMTWFCACSLASFLKLVILCWIHTATHCNNALQQRTATTHCNTHGNNALQQRTATTHCNTHIPRTTHNKEPEQGRAKLTSATFEL